MKSLLRYIIGLGIAGLFSLVLFTPRACGLESAASVLPPAGLSAKVLKDLGVSKGLCVLVGDTRCELALALARQSEFLIYAQMPSERATEQARSLVEAAGFYGTRIYVDQGPMNRLPLADNLADAVVAVGEGAVLSEAEALRVLHPQAKALLGTKVLVKPSPAGADDWSHPYHGPDNNPQSRDQLARAPYLTQFLADPRYAPLPQLGVASAGRVFKAFGHIAFKEREEPWLNTLAAFNGYNGTLLWKQPIAPSLMVHRNIMVATPDRLYFGDDQSCKIYDAASGELQDEIKPPLEAAGGTFWKWMALDNGVIFALIGEQEQRDPVIRAKSTNHGWPWDPLSPGFNQPEHTWGFGRTMVAIDTQTKRILWRYQETEPIDSRAVCLKNNRIFLFRFGAFLACLDAKSGQPLWRQTPQNAPALFEALGPYLKRQDWRTNWRTTAYLKCSDQVLYFSGPTIARLLAVSAKDGQVLWQHPYNNYQLVLHDDCLYGISGQIDTEVSRKFNALTGEVLAEIKMGRRACTRPTGAIDAIFFRAGEGSTRLDLDKSLPELISPMRAQCHDGVTIANGLLYWWPSVCDCNLTLYGVTCLGPAGDFDFSQTAQDSERLISASPTLDSVVGLRPTAADWPMFRADNSATATTEAQVPGNTRLLWQAEMPVGNSLTPPAAVGSLAFLSGSDGVVRALDTATGKPRWKAFTGGAVRIPPSIADGRAYVGSGDGWVYALEAATGKLIWRFRAAPVERRIPVYGQLLSTWPAASGVLVDQGVVYVAAGIVNYDGTHVYALDAQTGRIHWQNNASGHLDEDSRTGVGVQGHMILLDGKLYLAGGNAVSPAIYDVRDGKCLNDAAQLQRTVDNNVVAALCPRGWELYRIGNQVMVSGKPFYSHPKYPVFDASVLNKTMVASVADRDLLWVNNAKVMCFVRGSANQDRQYLAGWGKPNVPGLKPVWEQICKDSLALAVALNAVLVAGPSDLVALDLQSGRMLWKHPLPAAPVPWGLAVDREGRAIVSLENSQVMCFGKPVDTL